MTIRFHDTLARAEVELAPREAGHVSMYVCGPTVYDAPHVGHGRYAVVFDVVRRYLEWRGITVRHVSNVTDIDDKIIGRAAAAGTTESELARRYEALWWHEMERLGVLRPHETPRATEYVERMVDLVAELVERGHAYVVPGRGVYFDVASFPDYGALPHRDLRVLLESAGARVEVDDAKRSPVDFALWKAAKPGEPTWDSPWGPGRPGWHVECSAMSLDLLGEGFDLHGGGQDLVFPHHENERAQAEAAGHGFARHWMHSGMVEVGGQKMSKSLGNFRTLADALDAHGPRAFRLAVLQSHYRAAMDLGDVELGAAARAVERIDTVAQRLHDERVVPVGSPDPAARERFVAAMDDDFDTQKAVAVVFDLVRTANSQLDAGHATPAAGSFATALELLGALGLGVVVQVRGDGAASFLDDLPGVEKRETADPEIDALVAERDAARAARDFATADRIRDELAARGVSLEDTSAGTVWHR